MIESDAASAGSVDEPSTANAHRTQISGVSDNTRTPPGDGVPVNLPVQQFGTLLGPYRLEAKIGEGGMGAVYKATHLKLDKTVAVKILPTSVMRRKEAVARFEREMKAVGRLSHPHIVQAHDAGEVNGIHYIAMEYVEGTDLSQFVKQHGPLSVTNACKVIRQAAQALVAAHAKGLIHRDLKPSNMLLAKATGQIKLLDLGLARLMSDSGPMPDITVAGETFGTPDYMAPEQWENSHTADERADLYSLGCTLFFLLTGRAPYADDAHRHPLKKMSGHSSEPIPPFPALKQTVPEGVAAIYQKLMAKKPDDRYQTAQELADALQPFASSRSASSVSTAPVGETLPIIVTETVLPPKPPVKTNRVGLFGGGLAGLVLLAGIVIIITNKDGTKTKVEVPKGTRKVEITQGGRPVATVTPEEEEPVTPAEQRLKFFMQQREVAEFVLSRGGRVYLEWESDFNSGTRELTFKPGMTIPTGAFIVLNIELGDATLTGADLVKLFPASAVNLLTVNHVKLAKEDAKYLAEFPRVEHFSLLGSTLKTSWLPELTAPYSLAISTGMVDDQWAFLGRCPHLRHLLVTTDLENDMIPDLLPLGKYTKLRRLELRHHDIAPDVVEQLQRDNPRLLVTAKGKVVGRNPMTEAAGKLLKRGAAIYTKGKLFDATPKVQQLTADSLLQDGNPWRISDVRFLDKEIQITTDDIQELSAFDGLLSNVIIKYQRNSDRLAQALTELAYLRAMTFDESDLTDAGLAALERFNKLRYLDVRGNPAITKAGVEAFHKAVPACRLLNDHGEMAHDLAAEPVRRTVPEDDEPITPAEQRLKFFIQQREVAEFVLSRGGRFYLEWEADFDSGTREVNFKPGMEIPTGAFILRNIILDDATLTGADLVKLLPASRVDNLAFSHAKLAKEDAKHFADFPKVDHFSLFHSTLKTSWLPELTVPYSLAISTGMVDDQWAFLGRCPHLRHLLVATDPENDMIPDLLPLGKYTQLRWLELRNQDIASDVLEQLQRDNPRLLVTAKGKVVGRNPMTEAAGKLLKRGASIYANGKLFDAAPKEQQLTADSLLQDGNPWRISDVRFLDKEIQITTDDIQELSVFDGLLSNVTIKYQRNSDRLAQALTELAYLRSMTFDESDLTDAGLAALERFNKLRYLNVLGNPAITKAGIDAFHRAVPMCRLLNDHGEIAHDIAAEPVRRTAPTADHTIPGK